MEANPKRKYYSYELQKVQTPYGWLGSCVDRTLRKMAEKGILNKERSGKYELFYLPETRIKKIPFKVDFKKDEDGTLIAVQVI